jgi:outer membrane protein TolC
MSRLTIVSLLLVVCFGWPLFAFAQSQSAFLERSLASNDITQRLPSLDTLLKAAERYSPLLKEHDANIALTQIEEQMQRRDWMRYLGVNVGWSYGQFDALTVNPDAAVGVATTTSSQNRYTLGAFFKMPLFAVINRGNAIQQTQIAQEQAHYRRQFDAIEVRKLVIIQYQDLVRAHRLLLISNNSFETIKLQAERTEREFVDGLINVSEYSRIYDMLINATEALETRKITFVTAYLLLEETMGMKLNL